MTIDLNIVFLVLALLSIAFSIFAIWQASEFKKAADLSEKAAQKALSDITSEMRFLREYAIPELKSYGKEMRKFLFNADLKSLAAGGPKIGSTSAPLTPVLPTPTPEVERGLRRELIDTIKSIRSKDGKAMAMTVFAALNERYDFGVILGEVIALKAKNVLSWESGENVPQAFDDLQIVGDI